METPNMLLACLSPTADSRDGDGVFSIFNDNDDGTGPYQGKSRTVTFSVDTRRQHYAPYPLHGPRTPHRPRTPVAEAALPASPFQAVAKFFSLDNMEKILNCVPLTVDPRRPDSHVMSGEGSVRHAEKRQDNSSERRFTQREATELSFAAEREAVMRGETTPMGENGDEGSLLRLVQRTAWNLHDSVSPRSCAADAGTADAAISVMGDGVTPKASSQQPQQSGFVVPDSVVVAGGVPAVSSVVTASSAAAACAATAASSHVDVPGGLWSLPSNEISCGTPLGLSISVDTEPEPALASTMGRLKRGSYKTNCNDVEIVEEALEGAMGDSLDGTDCTDAEIVGEALEGAMGDSLDGTNCTDVEIMEEALALEGVGDSLEETTEEGKTEGGRLKMIKSRKVTASGNSATEFLCANEEKVKHVPDKQNDKGNDDPILAAQRAVSAVSHANSPNTPDTKTLSNKYCFADKIEVVQLRSGIEEDCHQIDNAWAADSSMHNVAPVGAEEDFETMVKVMMDNYEDRDGTLRNGDGDDDSSSCHPNQDKVGRIFQPADTILEQQDEMTPVPQAADIEHNNDRSHDTKSYNDVITNEDDGEGLRHPYTNDDEANRHFDMLMSSFELSLRRRIALSNEEQHRHMLKLERRKGAPGKEHKPAAERNIMTPTERKRESGGVTNAEVTNAGVELNLHLKDEADHKSKETPKASGGVSEERQLHKRRHKKQSYSFLVAAAASRMANNPSLITFPASRDQEGEDCNASRGSSKASSRATNSSKLSSNGSFSSKSSHFSKKSNLSKASSQSHSSFTEGTMGRKLNYRIATHPTSNEDYLSSLTLQTCPTFSAPKDDLSKNNNVRKATAIIDRKSDQIIQGGILSSASQIAPRAISGTNSPIVGDNNDSVQWTKEAKGGAENFDEETLDNEMHGLALSFSIVKKPVKEHEIEHELLGQGSNCAPYKPNQQTNKSKEHGVVDQSQLKGQIVAKEGDGHISEETFIHHQQSPGSSPLRIRGMKHITRLRSPSCDQRIKENKLVLEAGDECPDDEMIGYVGSRTMDTGGKYPTPQPRGKVDCTAILIDHEGESSDKESSINMRTEEQTRRIDVCSGNRNTLHCGKEPTCDGQQQSDRRYTKDLTDDTDTNGDGAEIPENEEDAPEDELDSVCAKRGTLPSNDFGLDAVSSGLLLDKGSVKSSSIAGGSSFDSSVNWDVLAYSMSDNFSNTDDASNPLEDALLTCNDKRMNTVCRKLSPQTRLSPSPERKHPMPPGQLARPQGDCMEDNNMVNGTELSCVENIHSKQSLNCPETQIKSPRIIEKMGNEENPPLSPNVIEDELKYEQNGLVSDPRSPRHYPSTPRSHFGADTEVVIASMKMRHALENIRHSSAGEGCGREEKPNEVFIEPSSTSNLGPNSPTEIAHHSHVPAPMAKEGQIAKHVSRWKQDIKRSEKARERFAGRKAAATSFPKKCQPGTPENDFAEKVLPVDVTSTPRQRTILELVKENEELEEEMRQIRLLSPKKEPIGCFVDDLLGSKRTTMRKMGKNKALAIPIGNMDGSNGNTVEQMKTVHGSYIGRSIYSSNETTSASSFSSLEEEVAMAAAEAQWRNRRKSRISHGGTRISGLITEVKYFLDANGQTQERF